MPRGVKDKGVVRRTLPIAGCGLAAAKSEGYTFDTTVLLGAMMLEFLAFISYVLTLYIYVLIAAAVMSWLVAFNVVNPRNPIVAGFGEFLYRITEPLLRPIRNMLPHMGGIDISPVILILIIVFVQSVVIPNIAKVFI